MVFNGSEAPDGNLSLLTEKYEKFAIDTFKNKMIFIELKIALFKRLPVKIIFLKVNQSQRNAES